MALELQFQSEYLATPLAAAYARVTQLVCDYALNQASIRVAVYADAASRNAGAKPLTDDIIINVAENTTPNFLDTLGGDNSEKGIMPRAIAYTILKALPQFAAAKDA